MTEQASRLMNRIESLPERDQRLLAGYLTNHLEEVLDEARWQELFDRSPEMLDQMSAEVDQAIARGDFAKLDPRAR